MTATRPVPCLLTVLTLLGLLGSCRPAPDPAIVTERTRRLLDAGVSWPRAAPAANQAPSPVVDVHSLGVDVLLGPASDGRWGYLLRETGGPVLYTVRADEPFEPASTLKIAVLAYALLAVARGQADLEEPIPWYQGSDGPDDPATPEQDEREFGCPQDTDPAVGTLTEGLRAMMERSDNRWTLALERRFGRETIERAARDAGMEQTLLRHRIGCAYAVNGDPGQLDAPNRATLRELAGLVEAVSGGTLLPPPLEAVFFELMANDPLLRLHTVIQEENRTAQLPPSLLQAVEEQISLAWKTGKYNIGLYKCQSVVGRARLPVYQGEGRVAWRELVFAVFVDDATRFPEQGTRATLFSLAVVSELLRAPVADLLASWRVALQDQARLVASAR